MSRHPHLSRDFWRHFGYLLIRGVLFPWGTLKTVDTTSGRVVVGFLIFGIAGTGLGAAITGFFQGLPLWVPAVVFLLLFLYGLAGASYERIEAAKDGHGMLETESNEKLRRIEAKNAELEEKLAMDKKRVAFKDLLGEAYGEGARLIARGITSQEYELEFADFDKRKSNVAAWRDRTSDLIADALGAGERKRFLAEISRIVPEWARTHMDLDEWIEGRLKQLERLMERADVMDLRPDFDPQDHHERRSGG